MILGNFLAFPLWPVSWNRPTGSPDYRVTNTFNGPDFLNGGIHRAVDVGNFRMGDPLRAPVSCRARGRKHTDGALGVEFDLGGGVVMGLWHLNRLDISLNWGNVARGQLVGITGNSGARLPNGQPMPAHTHIELKRNGVPFDPEPHLPMANRAAQPIPMEDTMALEGLALGQIAAGVNLRRDPSITAEAKLLDFTAVDYHLLGIEPNGGRYQLGGQSRTDWARVRRGSDWWVAAPLITNLRLTPHGTRLLPAADCSAEQNRIDRARTALTGASQALGVAREALG
jgi:hypothetical protein